MCSHTARRQSAQLAVAGEKPKRLKCCGLAMCSIRRKPERQTPAGSESTQVVVIMPTNMGFFLCYAEYTEHELQGVMFPLLLNYLKATAN